MPTTPESRIKIQVNNLTKRFGDLTVLDGINFNIKEGELLAIVGPTGCGKTTFLNTLSKLMPATEGEILIDGEEANPKKHNISYVFQEPTCLPWRTVRENVAYGMEVKGVGKEEREARATQIMDLVGLSSCADLYPNQVSASMMQRIAVSRAFAVNPDLLLMDEPFAALDVGLKHELYGLLREQVAQRGTAVLMITHDLMEAVRLADRIVVMTAQPGRVLRAFRVALPQAQRSEAWIYDRTAHLMQMPDVRASFGMPPLPPTDEAAATSSAAIRCGKKGGDEGLVVTTGSCSASDALPRQGGCTV